MDACRFLVFTRQDRFPWGFDVAFADLKDAIRCADDIVARGDSDRAVVMEVGSTDAMPLFTWKYRAKKA